MIPALADLQSDLVHWHEERFPEATLDRVALKLGEEVGELMGAVVAQSGTEHPERVGKVGDEGADVFIVLLVLLGRYFPEVDLTMKVREKLTEMEWRDG